MFSFLNRYSSEQLVHLLQLLGFVMSPLVPVTATNSRLAPRVTVDGFSLEQLLFFNAELLVFFHLNVPLVDLRFSQR
jgi:hypothetical protein